MNFIVKLNKKNTPSVVADGCTDLMQYLPEYWKNVEQMQILQKRIGSEIWNVNKSSKKIIDQSFIETATCGLNRWETMFWIPTDKTKSFECRREQIKAKIRGTGTVTKKMIENVASAFSGGESIITEYPKESRFEVKFTGIKGVPANMQGLTDAINMIKPAHLIFSYHYTYNFWDNLKNKTWGDLKTSTWDQMKTI